MGQLPASPLGALILHYCYKNDIWGREMKRSIGLTIGCAMTVLSCTQQEPPDNRASLFSFPNPPPIDAPRTDKDSFDVIHQPTAPRERRMARFTYAEQGVLLSREVSYLGSEIVSYYDIKYIGNTTEVSIVYDEPGTDLTWFTSDDVINHYTRYGGIDPQFESISYDTPGPDGIWLTSDDHIRYYRVLESLPSGDSLERVMSIPGADGLWFTADDEIGWITRKAVIVQGREEVSVYTSAGADNDWYAFADNTVYQHWQNVYDTQGLRARHILYSGVGTDGLPFTTDDLVVYYHDYVYDALGRIESNIMYHGGPGADNIWFTADDNIHSCKQLTRDANDLPIRTTTYQTGPDLQCFSADDLVWGYHDDIYTNGQLVRSNAYYGSGPDAIWFTLDDVIVSQREYIPSN